MWTFLENSNVKIHNQDSENAVKLLSMIRKNSLVFNNKNTAILNCNLLTIVQTAAMHQKDVGRYLNYVLHYIDVLDNIDDLLPWSEKLCIHSEDYVI